MNDHHEPSSTTPSTYAQTRDALYREVYSAVNSALTKALEAHDRTVYGIGHGHGYELGWEEATKRFSALLADRPQPPPPPVDPIDQSHRLEASGDADRSAKDIVLDLIRRSPGLRGVELVEAAEKAGTPLNERTVRTALHRLKIDNAIRNDDGKWFAIEAVAA